MGKLFNYDSGIMRFLNKAVDCFFLSFLWLIFSIPVITLGASTTALYYVANKVIRHDRSHVWREFWHSFKTNFKQSTIIWLILMVMYWVLIANCFFYWKTMPNEILLAFNLVITLFVTMWALHVFPFIARFYNGIKAIMKSCLLMSIRHMLKSFCLLILFVVAVILLLMWPVAIFFLPALYMLVATFILEPMYRRYMSEEDLAAENERNMEYFN